MAVSGVEQMAPPFRAGRLLTRRLHAVQPADWVDALRACREPALALVERQETPGAVRRALGVARKAMREPAGILAALNALERALASSAAPDRTD